LRTDGTVWAWGNNSIGQLGDGTTNRRLTPVQVTGLTNIRAIAAGEFHSLALKQDGTVWAWGYNYYGQLGDGTTTDRRNAFQIQGLTNITAIAVGDFHSLALKQDGTVLAWGYNQFGQLGDGSTQNRLAPVPVSGLTTVRALATGSLHSLALRQDGSVWTWGYNAFGQLGLGNTTDRNTPAQIPGLANIVGIAGGWGHSVALRREGTVWSWGYNQQGQLGDGTTSDRTSPVQVRRLYSARAIAAGRHHTLALMDATGLWQSTFNNNQVWYEHTQNGVFVTGTGRYMPLLGNYTGWPITDVTDLDGDGQEDLLWQLPTTGRIWFDTLQRSNNVVTINPGLRGNLFGTGYGASWRLTGNARRTAQGNIALLYENINAPDSDFASTTFSPFWYEERSFPAGQLVRSHYLIINNIGYKGWKVIAFTPPDNLGVQKFLWQGEANGAIWYEERVNGVYDNGRYLFLNGYGASWKVAFVSEFENPGGFALYWQNPTTGVLWYEAWLHGRLNSGLYIKQPGYGAIWPFIGLL
jgi:hypothetical protein